MARRPVSLLRMHSRVAAQSPLSPAWLGLPVALPDAMPVTALVYAAAAAAVATAAFAVTRTRSQRLARELAATKAALDARGEAQTMAHAVLGLDRQCVLRFVQAVPVLVANTVASEVGVPGKPSQLVRFAAWLDPEDAGAAQAALDALVANGTAFALTATTQNGHAVELHGAVAAGEAWLRIRPYVPVNRDMIRLMGDTRKHSRRASDQARLLDAIPNPAWQRDAGGKLVWVNQAYASAVGAKSPAQAVASQIELIEERHRAAISRDASKPCRVRTVVGGAVVTYDVTHIPLDRGGVGGIAVDVRPLADVQSELNREAAAHLHTLERVSTAVAMFGRDGRIAYINAAFMKVFPIGDAASLTGLAFGDLLDRLRQSRLVPDQANYRRWRDDKTARFAKSRALDEIWHCGDGVSLQVHSEHRPDGSATLFVDDVTERIALERQFHSALAIQQETLDHMAEGLAVFGADGRLRLANPAFRDLWGFDEHTAAAGQHVRSLTEAAGSHGDVWNVIRSAVTSIGEGRDVFTGAFRKEKDRYYVYAGTPLPDGGTLLTFRDVTDSKRVETVLLERNEALEAADRLQSAFLSHVSYELRTPLTSIIGFTDLLAEPAFGTLNDKQRDYLNDIRISAETLKAIIDDILDLAVIDAGALDLKLRPVPVQDIVAQAQLGVRERLAAGGITLDVYVADNLPDLHADPERLTQVLFNLILQAIASSSPAGGVITLSCRAEGGMAVFAIQDGGAGSQQIEATPYTMGMEGRGTQRGSGLGLSLVKSLVELHKGQLAIHTTPEAGTVVYVRIPFHVTASTPAQAVPAHV